MIKLLLMIKISFAAPNNLPKVEEIVNKAKTKINQANIDQKVDKSVKIVEKVVKESYELSKQKVQQNLNK